MTVRQAVFFDMPDSDCSNRESSFAPAGFREGDDSVVKLRPVVPDLLPGKLRKSPNFGVEVDAMPGGFVCSASLNSQWGGGPVKAVLRGEAPISSVFSKEQRAFYAEHAPRVGLHDLAQLGPINLLKLRFVPAGMNRRHVAELWFYPNGSRSSSSRPNHCLPRRSRRPPNCGRTWRKGHPSHRRAADQDPRRPGALRQGGAEAAS